ncbi:hypothetical protein ABW19_dt0209121 [Dactylella cylindrospora]|nr:hypothetical protein ABW19_dt0209121 [Dactylella cylindrospora]
MQQSTQLDHEYPILEELPGGTPPPASKQGLKLQDLLATSYDICLLLQLYLPPISLISLHIALHRKLPHLLPPKGLNISHFLRLLSRTIPPSESLRYFTKDKIIVYSQYLETFMTTPPADHLATHSTLIPRRLPNGNIKYVFPRVQLLKILPRAREDMISNRNPDVPNFENSLQGEKIIEAIEEKYPFPQVTLVDVVSPPLEFTMSETLDDLVQNKETANWVLADGYVWFVRGWGDPAERSRAAHKYYRGETLEWVWDNMFAVLGEMNAFAEIDWAKRVKVPVYADD